MNIFYEEHRLLLQALIQYHVSFMLIGGYAVNYYGYNRTTGDMDIWLKPDNNNKTQLINALNSLNFDLNGLQIIKSWDFTKPQKFHIGIENQPDKTEFMTHISGVSFIDADEIKIFAELDGMRLPIIHINSLKQNKISSGRLKDLVDVEYLDKIFHLKNKNM